MVNPVLIERLPSRKWLNVPENVVKAIAPREIPRAVWIEIPKKNVKIDTTIAAPPTPIKPITHPKKNIVNKIIITNLLYARTA